MRHADDLGGPDRMGVVAKVRRCLVRNACGSRIVLQLTWADAVELGKLLNLSEVEGARHSPGATP